MKSTISNRLKALEAHTREADTFAVLRPIIEPVRDENGSVIGDRHVKTLEKVNGVYEEGPRHNKHAAPLAPPLSAQTTQEPQ
jgi:hypothetical protein